MLDLVFISSNSTTINICDELLVPLDKYHPALSINSNYNFNRDDNYNSDLNWYYDFKIADYNSICWSLGSINWHTLFENKNINETVYIFYDIVHNLITKYVPKMYLPKKV